MKPWGDTPRVLQVDVNRIEPRIANMKTLVAFLGDKKTTVVELKKAIMIETVLRDKPREYVLDRCFKKLNKLHRANARRILKITRNVIEKDAGA